MRRLGDLFRLITAIHWLTYHLPYQWQARHEATMALYEASLRTWLKTELGD